MLPKQITTFAGIMPVREWRVIRYPKFTELIADLGVDGTAGNGYQDEPCWYVVDAVKIGEKIIFGPVKEWEYYGLPYYIRKSVSFSFFPKRNCGCL